MAAPQMLAGTDIHHFGADHPTLTFEYHPAEKNRLHSELLSDLFEIGIRFPNTGFSNRTSPAAELAKRVSRRVREQDMAAVSRVHHALRNIDTAAGDVEVLVDIADSIDRARVQAHSQLQMRMLLESARDF